MDRLIRLLGIKFFAHFIILPISTIRKKCIYSTRQNSSEFLCTNSNFPLLRQRYPRIGYPGVSQIRHLFKIIPQSIVVKLLLHSLLLRLEELLQLILVPKIVGGIAGGQLLVLHQHPVKIMHLGIVVRALLPLLRPFQTRFGKMRRFLAREGRCRAEVRIERRKTLPELSRVVDIPIFGKSIYAHWLDIRSRSLDTPRLRITPRMRSWPVLLMMLLLMMMMMMVLMIVTLVSARPRPFLPRFVTGLEMILPSMRIQLGRSQKLVFVVPRIAQIVIVLFVGPAMSVWFIISSVKIVQRIRGILLQHLFQRSHQLVRLPVGQLRRPHLGLARIGIVVLLLPRIQGRLQSLQLVPQLRYIGIGDVVPIVQSRFPVVVPFLGVVNSFQRLLEHLLRVRLQIRVQFRFDKKLALS